MYTFVVAVFLAAGVAYLAFLVIRHLPDLRNLDVTSISEEKQDKAKEKMLEAQIARQSAKIRTKLSQWFLPQTDFVTGHFKKLKQRIADWETKYQAAHQGHASKSVEELFVESKDLINEEDYSEAEKLLIEIITRDKKNAKAYELLGELYFETKAYDQAEEVYRYLLRLQTIASKDQQQLDDLSLRNKHFDEDETEYITGLEVDPKVAVYYDDLAQVYEATQQPEKALDCFLKASAIEPNNPKYLDKLIEYSLQLGDKGLAKKTFFRLKHINPENAKLDQLKIAIEKM